MNLIETGEQALSRARQRASQSQAEAFLVESESRVSEWSEGLPENRVLAQVHGLGLRLINEGRLGFSHTNRLDGQAIDTLVERASAAARSTGADPFLDVPTPVALNSDAGLQLVDEALTGSAWDSRASFLASVETDVKKRDKRLAKVLRAAYREGHSRMAVVNSRGLSAVSEGTSASFSIACVAVEGGETQIGYGFQAERHYADLKPDWVIDKAVEHTLSLLGGKQVPSGRYDLILDPWIAAEMLELFAGALRADQVLKGKSFFATKVGQQVGAACLNLIDNGRLPRRLGTSPFDAEGLPTQETILLKNGVLQGFLYDSYTARKAKKSSTGNAGRGSYKGVPEPEPTNFYLQPGTESPEKLVSQVRSGLYIRNMMGLHTVDTISGDFSLGIMGQRIENGQRTHGVRGVTIAGNLLDLLKNVAALGSDLIFSGSVGSPTLWIKDISVGGAS